MDVVYHNVVCRIAKKEFVLVAVVRIDSAGVVGVALVDLYNDITQSLPTLTCSSLEDIVQQMEEYSLVFGVGVCTRTYVSHINARTWLIHSLKNTRGKYVSMVNMRVWCA